MKNEAWENFTRSTLTWLEPDGMGPETDLLYHTHDVYIQKKGHE